MPESSPPKRGVRNAHRDFDHEIQNGAKTGPGPEKSFHEILPVARPLAAHFKIQRVSASFAEVETLVHKTQDVV